MLSRLCRLALSLCTGLFSSACYTTSHATTETINDPAALVQSIYWTGIFWTVAVIGTTIAIVAWAVVWYLAERADSKAQQAKYDAELARLTK